MGKAQAFPLHKRGKAMTQKQIDAIVFPVMDCLAVLVKLALVAGGIAAFYFLTVVAFAIDCGM